MPIIYRISFASIAMLFLSGITSVDCHAESPNYPVAKADQILSVWPASPPDWAASQEPESDTSGPDARKQAGESVIRIGNVSVPQLHVYHPDNGPGETAVLVCPGGGYSILAWDLEGTEIATWLTSVGVTAVVVKYRVPTRSQDVKWLAPVQDIQRSIAVLRSGGVKDLKPNQIGVLGFSAGGNASARTALASKRHYKGVDAAETDQVQSFRPDFAVLVYPAWLNEKDSTDLIEELQVDEKSPPMFLAHADDDRISALSSVAVYSALTRNKVPSELHVFGSGGHGFGGRVAGTPTDAWRDLCAQWMRSQGWLK